MPKLKTKSGAAKRFKKLVRVDSNTVVQTVRISTLK